MMGLTYLNFSAVVNNSNWKRDATIDEVDGDQEEVEDDSRERRML